MSEKLRQSGIDIIGDIPWGTHFCQFYQTKEDLMDTLIPYLRAGLENNEFCLWITSQPLKAKEAEKALRKAVPDLDIYLERKQIEITTCTHEYVNEDIFDSEKVINGWIKKLNQTLTSGFEGLRLAGNTVCWLIQKDWGYFADHEKKVDANIGKPQIISLCSYFLDICSAADIIEIAYGHHFSLIKKKGKWELIENFGIRDVTECKRAEGAHSRNMQNVRLKLDTILSPTGEIASLELAEIVDSQAIQSLMDDFYKLTHVPVGIIDLKGNVMVGVGWQEICTRFHRIHPEASKHCIESDTKLSAGVAPGAFKPYKCKNNMWDIVTPITAGGRHIGNIFLGQFFFEGELLDYELFRFQARKYGFNEQEYISSLEKVPRLSRETVDTIMSFYMKLANMLSQLSYSNIKLAQSLAERDSLVDALRESEERFRSVLENSLDSAYRRDLQNNCFDYMSPVIELITGFSAKEINAMSINDYFDRIHPDDRPLVTAGIAQSLDEGFGAHEYRFKCKDGKYCWLADHFSIIKDKTGIPRFRAGIARDITDHKQAEETLAFERSQLLSIFDGIDDSVYVTDPYTYEVLYANKAMKERFGSELVGGICYQGLQQRDSPCDFCTNPIILKERDKPYYWEYYNPTVDRYFMIMDRVIKWPDGRDVRFEIAKDITERKRAEQALKKAHDSLEEKVKERTSELEKAYKSLKESEKGLAEAQKMAHIGNWEWDTATDKAFWSEEMFHIFGRNRQELPPPYNEYLNYIHPDDRDYFDNAVKKAMDGEPYSIDHRLVLSSGKVRTVHIKSEVIFNEEKIPIRIKGIVQDITERKRAEQALRDSEARLRQIYESDMFGILFYNLNGSITDSNDKFLKLVGYTREDMQAGKINWIKMTPPEYRLLDEHAVAELKATGAFKEPQEKEYFRKDGSRVPIILGIATYDKEHQEGIAFVLDITERKKTEKALAEIDRIRIKEIHHRIKNNLQVISSLLDLQAEKFLNKDVIKAFKESQNRVLSMSLIHEELYKGEGTETLDFSMYLRKLSENLFLTYSLNSKNIRLCMNLEEKAFFDMDTAVPLGIIVNELVSNSLKHAFTENQEGEIQIMLCREEENCEKHESVFNLAISDNGKGIPENMELKSLESLGLQLVSALVDQLDGEIEIKREKGTEFKITFKVAEKGLSFKIQ